MAPVPSKLASRSGIAAGSGVANPMAAGSTAAGSGSTTPGFAPSGRAQAMEVLWTSEDRDRARGRAFPCVDCGLNTGNFCDGGMSCAYDKCFAAERVPADYGQREGQSVMNGKLRTPLCSYCETLHEFCRFCRGVHSCTPPMVQSHWSGVPQSKSREFNVLVAAKARARLLLAQTTAAKERSTSETLPAQEANQPNALIVEKTWESWELEKCVCKNARPLGCLVPGETRLRCCECLRPYVPARKEGSCSPRPRPASGCQP